MQYGLIGEKLGHSFSKEIHSQLCDYEYNLYEMTEPELIKELKNPTFKAVNITIPYKQTVIPYLSYLTPEAKNIGAVNCIKNTSGKLIGHNTDFDGICGLFHHANISPENKKVLILGTGGTSKTALVAVKKLGVAEAIKVSRTPKNDEISYHQAITEYNDAQIIINTTPCGMFPNIDCMPIDLIPFKNLYGVIDVIYNPLETLLVRKAKKMGIKADGGLYMLVCQAVKAAEFFIDKTFDPTVCEDIYKKILFQKNIGGIK